MATDVDRAFYNGWPQDELSDGDDSKDFAKSQMHDHGSISFGRFSVESLSWERRSVFVHNRHQEELEKFNGLVAKKKAYFEERYRRIRASKALNQSQATELTLDYGGDGSNSSQTEEENESVSHHESPRESETNTVDARPEEVQDSAIFDQEISYKEVVHEISSNTDPNSAVVPLEITLSEEITDRIEHEESSNGDIHVDRIDAESSSVTEKVEEIEEVDKGRIYDDELKLENVAQKVANKEVNEAHGKGFKDSESNKSRSTKKPLYSKTAPNVKGSSAVAATRNGRPLDRVPKQNAAQTPKGSRVPSQKISGKAENRQTSGNIRTVQQVNNNRPRSALAPSNRSLAEPHSRITTPGAFTLAMEKRASHRVSAAKYDAVNIVKFPSSSIRVNSSNIQDISRKKGTVSGVTSRGAESKKLISEIKNTSKKPLATDTKQTSMKTNETPLQRTVKPRLSSSINLPARSSTIRAASQLPTFKLPKQEVKETTQTKQPHGMAVKSLGSSTNGNSKIVTKKTIQAKYNEKVRGGNKQRFDNLSLDGRRTSRQDTQHWR